MVYYALMMRKLFFAFAFSSIAITLAVIVAPRTALAQLKPFAGIVVSVTTPPFWCYGEGVITIVPNNESSPFPYVITPLTIPYMSYVVKPKAQIMGETLVEPIFGLCYYQAGPYPIPIPAFPIISYGVSAE